MTISQPPDPDLTPAGEQALPKADDEDQPTDEVEEHAPKGAQPAEIDPLRVISSALDASTDDQIDAEQLRTDPPAPDESAVPEPSVPEPSAPESAVPESAVPEPAVPESAVPEASAPEAEDLAADEIRTAQVGDWADASPDATQVVPADIVNASGSMPPLDRPFDALAAPPPLHGSPPRGFPAPSPYGQVPVPPPPQHGQPPGQPYQHHGPPPHRSFDGLAAPAPLRGSSPGGFPSAAPPQYGQQPQYRQPPGQPLQQFGQPPQQYAPSPYGQPHYAPASYAQARQYGQSQPYPQPQQNGQPVQFDQNQQYGQAVQYSPAPPYLQQPYGQAAQPYGGQPGHEPVMAQYGSAPPGWAPPFGVPNAGQLPGPLAGYGARVLSFLIDYLAPVIVLLMVILVSAGFERPELILMVTTLSYLGLFAFVIWNSCYRQGVTGQSIGRQVAGTRLVKIETGQPVGFGTALLRQICHNVEFVIGFLFPLWDARRQTFADKIVGTVVVRVDG